MSTSRNALQSKATVKAANSQQLLQFLVKMTSKCDQITMTILLLNYSYYNFMGDSWTTRARDVTYY